MGYTILGDLAISLDYISVTFVQSPSLLGKRCALSNNSYHSSEGFSLFSAFSG